jgi:hypothetical protein
MLDLTKWIGVPVKTTPTQDAYVKQFEL